ncbi:hypothetical protein PF005_g1509 [Phytophthora fragariae]|uniref:Reverse transcriptase Ty1/copia-type domain-containing protein n=1 Tax=Phytophthora fragariae TaxID=53985 RepID=A0A6A4AFB8_9STRA|nr:hypothetical protein PF003_g5402 [Phytophthora fragariae]KAE8949020.1 hypothetical protein PF009_g1433 [Phytophthora fragariae]KAE9029987.1 hypothetical protein PF011_g826 [Phytophthora fragariae]KAE9137908.1 hypothetical protein PF010_g1134 [Phytophthora fragariae]KAE9138696.1 hypothetical protein PF007_g1300 [Phytophthora fragariae]
MDVKTAFLNGFLEEEIYMEQPVGYVQQGKEDHVCVLRKSIYGLKQAPRVWYYTFDEVMRAEGFVRVIKDHCVFIKTRGEICIISIYVDDLLVIGSKAFVSEMKDILKRRYQISVESAVYLAGTLREGAVSASSSCIKRSNRPKCWIASAWLSVDR